ncbi:hypothetical protein [Trinickia dabaoshanensis]|nr:hypothetical protein [Trinickia dabaoshanensis]
MGASDDRLGSEVFRRLTMRRPEVESIFVGNDDLEQGALFEAPNDVR